MNGKIFWGSLLILALAMVNSGIEGTNSVVADHAKIRTLTERVGMQDVVTWLKEQGIPMSPPALIGYLVVLLLIPKGWALAKSGFNLTAPHGKKAFSSTMWGIGQTPGLVKANPKTSLASAIAVVGLALAGTGYAYRDNLNTKWEELYSNHWVVKSPVGETLGETLGGDETSPQVITKTRWDIALEWCLSDVQDSHVATIFVVAAFLGLSIVFRKGREKKEPAPSPEVLNLQAQLKELEAKVKEPAAPLPSNEAVTNEPELPQAVRRLDISESMEKYQDALADVNFKIEKQEKLVKEVTKFHKSKTDGLMDATREERIAREHMQKLQGELELLEKDQGDFEGHLAKLKHELWTLPS